jgi:hypothetical protein
MERADARRCFEVMMHGLRNRRVDEVSVRLVAVLVASALGCNAVLDIDSAALEPAAPSEAATPGEVLAPDLRVDEALGDSEMLGTEATTLDPTLDTAAPAPSTGGDPAPSASAPGREPGVAPPPATAPLAPSAPPDAGASAPPPVPLDPPLDENGLAVALPNDLIGAPVSGEIIFSEEASWEVDGVFRPTFEVHTPTASYWIVKSLGTMVSMQDAYSGRLQWIDFSSGFRPLRNIPAFAAPPANISTLLDRDSQTPTHLRLTSESPDGAWRWVWDFYVTHATFTVDRAPVPTGLSYRGVPAGALGMEDQLVQSDGTAQGARNSFAGDLPGPVEWVYFADTAARRSLFLMQHRDDELAEAYQVRDNDSAAFGFGGASITALPLRFSLGIIDSTDHGVVSQRVAFVAGAIH